MERKLSIARIICLLVTVALVTATVYFAVGSYLCNRRFQMWQEARPASFSVDLSRPGSYSAPLKQTCQISHGEGVYIQLPDDFPEMSAEKLFDGLSGTIAITDLDGEEILREEFPGLIGIGANTAEPVGLAQFDPFEEGDYTITLEVVSGADALAGVEQTALVKYHICGMEAMPILILGILAVVCGLPGLMMTALVVPDLLRHGIWKAENSSV